MRGPGKILKELWTKEVNIPEVKTSYEYVTELRECLEDSETFKKHDKKAKPRCLEVGDQVLILLPCEYVEKVYC